MGKQKVIVRIRSVIERQEVINYEVELLDNLKDWRRIKAENEGVPPYIIFSDKVLIDLAQYLPRTMDELKEISGIGFKKLELYGKVLITLIRNYTKDKDFPDRMSQLMVKNQVKAERDSHLTETYLTTLMFYRKNMTPEQIAHKRLMAVSTIFGHIYKLVKTGKIDGKELVKFVDPKKAEVIKAKIQELGGSEIGLTPVKDALGDDYSYDEIRLVRMWI